MAYKLLDLRKALMAYKKQKKFKGTPSKMKKGEIMEALKSLNFDFTSLSSSTKSSTEYDKKKEAPSAPTSAPSSKRGRKPKVNVPPSATKSPLVYDKATGTYVKQVPKATSSSVPPKKGRKSYSAPPPPFSSVPPNATGSVPSGAAGRGRGRGRPRNVPVPSSSMELVPVLKMKPATDTQYGRIYKSRVPLLTN